MLHCQEEILSDIKLIKSEMHRVHEDMKKIMHIVVEGNGHSLVSKIAIIEDRIHEHRSNNMQIKVAVMTAVGSFVASLGVVIFEIVARIK